VLENGTAGEEYIGSGSDNLVSELAKSISPLEIKTTPISDWLDTYGSWSAGYGIKQVFSSDKAIKNLGWKPQTIHFDNNQLKQGTDLPQLFLT
jgi:hypothetical protein